MNGHRRCVLFVVDALSDRVVRQAIEQQRLPHMAQFIQDGQAVACTSIFPSITPAATCSIATGRYPAGHGIEGAFWYDREHEELAFYGDDLQLVLQRGMHAYLVDFGDRLNNERLQAPTIFERLADAGITSGSVNSMWFRGPRTHRRTTPLLLRAVAGKLPDEVNGPDMLLLGDFACTWPPGMKNPPKLPGGMRRRYGFDDETSAACMMAMAQEDQLPTFTLAYFPKNDDDSHEKGPQRAVKTALERFDGFLGEFVQALGGWQRFRQQYTALIVGDHAASEVDPDIDHRCIALTEILSSVGPADPVHGWQPDDRLFVCPNMRAAAIYQRHPDNELLGQVRQLLLDEPRVDQVIWSIPPAGRYRRQFFVATADRGELHFERAAQDGASGTATDPLGNVWQLRGNPAALGLTIDGDTIVEGEYPNALERIEGAFVTGSEPMWATARAGCEFAVKETRVHRAGSHGSLSADDSQSILLASGLPGDLTLAAPSRTIDVMGLCLQALGVSAPAAVR